MPRKSGTKTKGTKRQRSEISDAKESEEKNARAKVDLEPESTEVKAPSTLQEHPAANFEAMALEAESRVEARVADETMAAEAAGRIQSSPPPSSSSSTAPAQSNKNSETPALKIELLPPTVANVRLVADASKSRSLLSLVPPPPAKDGDKTETDEDSAKEMEMKELAKRVKELIAKDCMDELYMNLSEVEIRHIRDSSKDASAAIRAENLATQQHKKEAAKKLAEKLSEEKTTACKEMIKQLAIGETVRTLKGQRASVQIKHKTQVTVLLEGGHTNDIVYANTLTRLPRSEWIIIAPAADYKMCKEEAARIQRNAQKNKNPAPSKEQKNSAPSKEQKIPSSARVIAPRADHKSS